ncbi:MAG: hypothetical protein FJ222_02120 [Lentisphaerae bacterium]|nr:hypothetical protein [Lentisphaerota bacterium]
MADLTEAQRNAVRQWVEGGASLSDVQRRLKDEWGVSLTYMDVRLLTLDVGAQVKDKPEAKKTPAPPPDAAAGDELADDAPEGVTPADASHEPPAGGGPVSVSVSLDRLIRPGSMVSGDVTFSDGKKARWMLDQMGRLGLDGVPAGYRPAAEDVREFQVQLQKLLASKGY